MRCLGSIQSLLKTGYHYSLTGLLIGAICTVAIAQEEREYRESPADSAVPSHINIPKENGVIYRDPFGARVSAPPGERDRERGRELGRELRRDLERERTAIVQESSSSKIHQAVSNQAPADNKAPKIAVIYFSQPERINSEDVDELSGASVIYNHEIKNHQGIMEYLAHFIERETGATVTQLSSIEGYPKDHDDLISQAALEYDTRARPTISLKPYVNLSEYDIIMIGYPIWWYDLPMPLYSFFEEYDLSGKTIIPFCTHGGSRPHRTFSLIAKQEPNAQVLINQGIVINRLEVPQHGQNLIHAWIHKLGLSKTEEHTHDIKNRTTVPSPITTKEREELPSPAEQVEQAAPIVQAEQAAQ